MKRRDFLVASSVATLAAALRLPAAPAEAIDTDVCIYGGTASGIAAALAVAKAGLRALIVEPSRWIGGMTGGGLMHIDWGRREAVGGLAREVLRDGLNDQQYRASFEKLVRDAGIRVLYEHRLGSVASEGNRLQAIGLDFAPPDRLGCPVAAPRTRGAVTVAARVFIDASYEGDLMAKAGVDYTWGREATTRYNESLAGVRPDVLYAVDPYLKPGEPRSGLLPLLQDVTPQPAGSADRLTMGYGFRYRFTVAPDRLPIVAPDDYDPKTFELYRRLFQSGVDLAGRKMHSLGAYEAERPVVYSLAAGNLSRSILSQVVYGSNATYPDGDWSARARIWKFHQDFLRGLTHFLRTDPSVPPAHRDRATQVGLAAGAFDDTAGWPHQLYVREARRMIADYVVTQHDVAGETSVSDGVGLASYGVDDWPYATSARDGKVALQGGDFSMLYLNESQRGIYPIPYRAIVPREKECRNLLVPVCCSASHIAMTSIRMEPVWMTLGESAGVAATLAIERACAVQRVDYSALRARLLARGVILDQPAKVERT